MGRSEVALSAEIEGAGRFLYQAYRDAVFRVCLVQAGCWHTAEDLCQETFAQALTTAAPLRDPEKARGWIFRIALNTCHAHRRRVRLRYFLRSLVPAFLLEAVSPVSHHDPAARAESRERMDALLAAMGELTDRERTLFTLTALAGLSLKEAAESLGVTYDTARQAISRARRRLRTRMAALERAGVEPAGTERKSI